MYRHLDELHENWTKLSEDIDRRLAGFSRFRNAAEERLFPELAFCLLAIQTSARRADAAVRELVARELLWQGTPEELARVLRRHVRFHNHKATYVIAARKRLAGDPGALRRQLAAFPSASEAREWLVREVDGFGYKEASHFLRNVGRGAELAILDRHVLKNLRRHGVIRSMPESLSRKRYLEIEAKVRRFAAEVAIPMAGLDLLFWSRETGEVFK